MTQRAGGPRPVPTLEMVAALAGVSRATVSRVVNDSPSVDPELAQSVRKAIEALDYTPNRAARSLAKRRANSVALIIPSPRPRCSRTRSSRPWSRASRCT